MIQWIIENYNTIIIYLVIIIAIALFLYRFFKQTKEKQLADIKEWLLWAVTQAEKDLGSGTGQLKLSMVYDMFIKAFPIISKLISFETFSRIVDDTLEKMRDLLDSNQAIKVLVVGKETLL